MCTVSWVHTSAGFELFANRDERIGRGPEIPPRVDVALGVRFVAPRDSDGGGTWIAANEHGLAVTLLNGYRRGEEPAGLVPGIVSRGRLVTDLAGAPSLDTLAERLAAAPLERYRSFVLLALAPGSPALVADWDGATFTLDPKADWRLPLVSSSFQSGHAARTRHARFAALREEHGDTDAAMLAAFHRSHADGPGPFSVCMHRDDAATRSVTRVRVDDERVELTYRNAPPCQPATESVHRLERAAADVRA